jgi:hypothetical protein
VEAFFREKGRPVPIYDKDALPFQMGSRHEWQPLCFAQVYDLRNEFMEITHRKNPTHESPDVESVRAVIHEDRDCDSFVKWRQGSTPKEHQEMIDRDRLLKLQEEQRNNDRKWQAEREEADRKWRSGQDRKMLVIAGCFTILGTILGAVITAIIQYH